MGAKDYLVKPIRLSECKALISKMKQEAITSESNSLSGLAKFEKIRELGHGASGSVLLVRNK
jgi:DNA-binding response OmpR family regulator